MLKNVSSVDRIIRLILGVVIAVLGIVFHSWWGLLSIILFATSGLSFCPIYAALRISSIPKK
ncbi:MAG TPA: DUF2892 domain-containing protein [Spirochaetia bacterium]|nr:DUF2892 domain-containing protein [Spirochaetia bacterium]